MNIIEELELEQIKSLGKSIPDFSSGDTVKVGTKSQREVEAEFKIMKAL